MHQKGIHTGSQCTYMRAGYCKRKARPRGGAWRLAARGRSRDARPGVSSLLPVTCYLFGAWLVWRDASEPEAAVGRRHRLEQAQPPAPQRPGGLLERRHPATKLPSYPAQQNADQIPMSGWSARLHTSDVADRVAETIVLYAAFGHLRTINEAALSAAHTDCAAQPPR